MCYSSLEFLKIVHVKNSNSMIGAQKCIYNNHQFNWITNLGLNLTHSWNTKHVVKYDRNKSKLPLMTTFLKLTCTNHQW